jgi:molybdate transport system substrate-binding protein
MRIKKVIFTLVVLTGFCAHTLSQDKIRIAAASDLKFAMDSVIRAFGKNTTGKVDVTYGSSGKLSEQIINGAPFDIFFSADVTYPQHLAKAHQTSSEIYPYAKGRIVVWSKKVDPTMKGLMTLVDSRIKKIAIANPLHAPYGKRAMESFENYRIMISVKEKLVYGENISQAAQFVSTGAADAGVIALSLALSPNMQREKGKYVLIPEDAHTPLIQGAVITMYGKNQKLAMEFFSFVKSQQAISILKHYGFTRP